MRRFLGFLGQSCFASEDPGGVLGATDDVEGLDSKSSALMAADADEGSR